MSSPALKDIDDVRWNLAMIWFIGAAVIALLFAVQSFAGMYHQNTARVWAWYLPNVMPVLALMIAVFRRYAVVSEQPPTKYIQTRYYQLMLWLSAANFLLVLLVLLLTPYWPSLHRHEADWDPMSIFNTASFVLVPVQALITTGLGALFFSPAEVQPGASPAMAPPIAS